MDEPTRRGRSRAGLGKWGERTARDFLEKRGYRIRETNYRCEQGEIDIVAEDGDCLVLVEVRSRRSTAFGSAKESLTQAKKERLVALAGAYAQAHADVPAQWRIDVVAIDIGPRGVNLELIPNAVADET